MAGATVVLADDHPVFRDGLVGLLERGGIDVLAAVEDGRAAVDAIRTHRPQVAIVDLQLPDIDGETVIDIVRREHCRRASSCSRPAATAPWSTAASSWARQATSPS